MKYLIAALPIATLVACGGGGGGGSTGPTGVSYGSASATTSATPNTFSVIQNGTTYNFDAYASSGNSYNLTLTGTTSAIGTGYSSANVTGVAAFDANGTAVLGVSGNQSAPTLGTNQTTATYNIDILYTAPNSVISSASGTLNADFGAGTLNAASTSGVFSMTGNISGGAIDGTINYVGDSRHGDGSGNFSGGFYGSNELYAVWSSTNTSGTNVIGSIEGELVP